jgi:RES domain-containing protein
MTAVREANQVGTLQPTTLVAYEAELENIFDTTDGAALGDEGMDVSTLAASTWRDEMRADGESRTQTFARSLRAKGYSALLVRSFAPGASQRDLNLVLWRWGTAPPARLTLIDDEGRLAF